MNFIEEIVSNDIDSRKNDGRASFRFPPEPNGEGLHIGHAKSACLNFGLAKKFNGSCNLRFDDTNPTTENTKYVEAMIKDIKWLGFTPTNICYTSDYFEKIYKFATELIIKGKAYVCDLSEEEMSSVANLYIFSK